MHSHIKNHDCHQLNFAVCYMIWRDAQSLRIGLPSVHHPQKRSNHTSNKKRLKRQLTLCSHVCSIPHNVHTPLSEYLWILPCVDIRWCLITPSHLQLLDEEGASSQLSRTTTQYPFLRLRELWHSRYACGSLDCTRECEFLLL